MKGALVKIGGAIVALLTLWACNEDNNKKDIVCWGDSLTAPHVDNTTQKGKIKGFFSSDSSYPSILQNLLGAEYNIVNCGVGGENTTTIMAREGAAPMVLAHDVSVFPSNVVESKLF